MAAPRLLVPAKGDATALAERGGLSEGHRCKGQHRRGTKKVEWTS